MKQEQIEKAAEQYAANKLAECPGFEMHERHKKVHEFFDFFDLQFAFEAGAEYVLNNQWHKAADLPTESDTYIALTITPFPGFGLVSYDAETQEWTCQGERCTVMRWAEIPTARK